MTETNDLRKYEISLIINPNLDDKEIDKITKKLITFVENNKGKLESKDTWGRRKLSYPIKKEKMGYYFFMIVDLSSEVTPKLEKEIKLDSNILRYLIDKK